MRARLIESALNAALTGKVPPGRWLILAGDDGTGWRQVDAALK